MSRSFLTVLLLLAVSAKAAARIVGAGDAVITDDGTYRYISASGLPDHATGQFPGPGNPNRISAQDYNFRVPLHPVANAAATPYYFPDRFGVAINGVPFDPYGNEWYKGDRGSGWEVEPMPGKLGLDGSHAHVQPGGAYHYHGAPSGLIAELERPGSPTLIGFAADGFPVYSDDGYKDPKNAKSAIVELHSSYRLKSGQRPGGADGPGGRYDGTYVQDYEYVAPLGDLDECNGRYGVTAEFPGGTYYYVVTAQFPYVPRMFHGTPDKSFARRPPPGGPRP